MKNKYNRFLRLTILMMACTLSLHAKTIYVAPTGTTVNNNSTYANPIGFDKIIAGSTTMPTSLLFSGDTLYFKGGIYNISKTFTLVQTGSNGKSATERTFVGSYPGETAIFDFRNQPYGNEETGSDNIGFKIPANYAHVQGLVVRYSGKNALYISGNNTLIENCTTYGNANSGMQLKSGGNNTIKNCDSFQNFDYKTMDGASPNFGGNADGFADKQYTSPAGMKNTYISCRAWENSDDGWDFFEHISAAGTYPTEIKESWCFKNGPDTYDMTDHPRYAKDENYFDTLTIGRKTGSRIVLINYGNGNGFKVGGNGTKHNVTVSNCVSFDNRVKGFDQNNNGGIMTFYNCTAYANRGANYGLGNTGKGATLTIKNCISAKEKTTNSFISTYTHTNNTWELSSKITVVDGDFISVDTTYSDETRTMDGSLPAMNGLFRLSANSQCKDKGIDVGLPYSGSAPDLGAFEYAATTGINQQSALEASTTVYPNPVSKSAHFRLDLANSSKVSISLFDMTGKKVMTIFNGELSQGANEIAFNRGSLPAGVYLYQVVCNNEKYGRHLILQ